jgi:hypothetical protein
MFTVHFLTLDKLPDDTARFKQFLKDFAEGVKKDHDATNNAVGGQAKFLAGMLTGPIIAAGMKSKTPLQWALSKGGPLPAELTKYGKYYLFKWTNLQRVAHVAKAFGKNFVFVFIAWETGVVIGSMINQILPQDTKDLIGATVYEIVNEGGWKNLWENPFGWKYWWPR